MKTYELPLTRNYVANWSKLEAIREFVQNALDSDSPFSYKHDKGQNTLDIHSMFSNLPVSSLLLGATTKSHDDKKIGNFGEGYKIAMLVLTRLEHKVEIFNDGIVWEPFFQHSRQFQHETLHVRERKARSSEPREGLTFRVHDIYNMDMEEIRQICLQMLTAPEIGTFITTPYGQILKDRPGKIYVGGLYITDTHGLKYGYNFNPEEVKLERDRQTVDGWDLYTATCKLWFSKFEDHAETIFNMIENGDADMSYARWNTPQVIKEALAVQFKKKHPNSIPVNNREQLDSLLQRGMTNVVYVNDNYGTMLLSDPEIKNSTALQLSQPAPLEQLQEFFKNKLSHWCSEDVAAFDQLLAKATYWKVK